MHLWGRYKAERAVAEGGRAVSDMHLWGKYKG